MILQPFQLQFEPAIQRDGTTLAQNAWSDGVWSRFQRGLPRKMGGYQTISQQLTGIPRALHAQNLSGSTYLHSGYAAGIEQVQIDAQGNTSQPANVTPVGFVSSPNNIWQMSSYFDTVSGQQQILAFVVPGLLDLDYGATTGSLYAGPIYSTTPLTSVSGLATDATGGVAVVPPYTFLYGSNGLVQWSVAGKPLDFTNLGSGAARVTDQKIVRALPLRSGGGFSPALLLWSIDSVIRMYFVGGAPVFTFDVMTDNSSILSHNSVVEVEGVFFWIGQDRFLTYNGVLQEMANNRNINFFFDNLNYTYAQKAFAVRNTRWGEIWFCAPLFNATEPNWAVIYNHRENTWYDTPLPNSGRSFGIINGPSGLIMSGVDLFNNSTYRLWKHEQGKDQVDGTQQSAILSSITSGVVTPATFQQPMDKGLHIDAIEQDFVQTGNATVNILTRGNSGEDFTTAFTGVFGPAPSADIFGSYIPTKTTGKQIQFQFVSNTLGGDYQMGKLITYIAPDQGRRTQ